MDEWDQVWLIAIGLGIVVFLGSAYFAASWIW